MFKSFMLIATGRSIYSTYFLLVLMVVAPAAVFTEYLWLDSLAWLMLIIIGVFVAITGLVTLKDGLQSAQWPRVEARVKNCSLTWRTNRGTKSYAPKISCQFRVKGQEFTGTQFDFSASYTSKDKAQALLDSVSSQRTLVIHYKPSDPAINVIHPGVCFVHYVRIIVGVVAVVVAVLSWLGIIIY